MITEFIPKGSSKYYISMNNKKDERKIEFTPKEIKIEKRIPKQFSYASRVERENLRAYNG